MLFGVVACPILQEWIAYQLLLSPSFPSHFFPLLHPLLLQNEIARLQKIGEDGEKLKKLALDADGAKRRIEIFTKILAGENRAAKLSERPKMKPNPPTVQFRMSGTVMLHPINVRKALSGRR